MRVLSAFERYGLDYVLIGATALAFHGIVRATEDVDVFVGPEVANIEKLRRALRDVYPDDASIDEIADTDLLGDYPAVRFYPSRGDLYFDLLTRLGEAVSFDSITREKKVVDGVTVSVATPSALYRLKRDTVRAIDRQDAEALRQRFPEVEEG